MRLGCDSVSAAAVNSSASSSGDQLTKSAANKIGKDFGVFEGEDDVQLASRKIIPVDGLVLKTPIAFRNDSDLMMIPIRKEGMAVCEKCGAIGVKHSFYTKERRFCSQACAKSFNENPNANTMTLEKRYSLQLGLQPGQQPANKKMGQPLEDVHIFSNKKRMQLAREDKDKDIYGFDWVEYLTEYGFVTPPISCFRHVPLCDTWASDVNVDMKVEVENTDTRQPAANSDPQSYWVASVISLMGYKALLRYEGFGLDDSKDFWVNMAAEDVHPVGWCASKGKPLIPPRTIQDKYTEWREFLVKRLTGARSLPNQFHSRVIEASRSRFRIGMTVEIIDRTRLSTVKVGTVSAIIGRRLKLRYADSPKDDVGFWCHEESSMIHPVGWALSVGHPIDATTAYLDRCAKRAYLPTDATGELFNELRPTPGSASGLKFKEGMKLEAVDPLNLDSICVATVVKVLRHGYLMIRIDRALDEEEDQDDPDEGTFCYHATSACIAPPGFCEANAIALKPPEGYEGRFRWGDYLRQTKAVAAPEALFEQQSATGVMLPQIRVGMRVEAADLMDSRLVCVATVAQVAGRLVRIHFDGWSEDFDQWMDSSSPELYPVGWCELSGYKLETPEAGNLHAVAPPPSSKKNRKPTGRGGRGKGRRGARGGSVGGSAQSSPMPSAQAAASKRDRSPSGDEAVNSGRSGSAKSAKLRTKSHDGSAPSRSLRPRSSLQQQQPAGGGGYSSSAEDPSDVPTREIIAVMDDRVVEAKSAANMAADAKAIESYFRAAGSAAVVAIKESAGTESDESANGGKRIPKLDRKGALVGVEPTEWNCHDVAQFLRVNDCATHSDAFINQNVDGRKFLSLTKDEVFALVQKVGPSVKIGDLISQLNKARAVSNGSSSRAPGLQSPLR